MTQSEFLEIFEKAERFYDKKLDNDQKVVWYESFKNMNNKRFKFLVSEWYRRFDYLPSLAKALSLDNEIGYANIKKEELKDKEKCEICEGRGFILYYKLINNYNYQFACRCNCTNAVDFMGAPTFEEVGFTEEILLEKRRRQKEKLKVS